MKRWPDSRARVPSRERVVALITVLFVVALATAAAASMTGDHQFDIRRTGNRIALTQAHQIALGGESWAMGILARDRRGETRTTTGGRAPDRNPEIDSQDEIWAQQLPPIPIEGGQVTGRIIDAQGRFNINNLIVGDRIDAVALARFERLLQILGLNREIAQAVIDWLDENSETTYPGGAEDDFYAALEDPYQAANQPAATASEMRLIRGIDAAAWRLLAPHIVALPEATAINVNTATSTVLRMIVPGLGEGEADQLAELVAEEPFDSVDAFRQHPLVRQAIRQGNAGGTDTGTETGSTPEGVGGSLAIGTSYFRVRVDVQIGAIEYRLYSWLARNDNGASRVFRRSRTPD
jgi:general secretion pathway protein K